MKHLLLICDISLAAGVVALGAIPALAAVRTAIGNDDMALPAPKDGLALRVSPDAEVGPIKPMNGSNSGPNVPSSWQDSDPTGRFDEFRDLEVPMIRTHDSVYGRDAESRQRRSRRRGATARLLSC